MPAGPLLPHTRDLFDGVRVIWSVDPAIAGPLVPAAADAVLAAPNPDASPADTLAALARLGARAPLLLLRCGGEVAALDAAVAGKCAAVVLAGCTGAAALQQASARLAVIEAERGRPVGATALVAEVGAAGLLALPGLVAATARFAALFWNPGTLAAACGATLESFAAGPAGTAIRPWLVVAGAAAEVPAYEVAAPGTGGAGAAQARALGFNGLITATAGDCAAIAAAFGRAG